MRRVYTLLFWSLVLMCFSCKPKTLFQAVSSSHSGIHFNNKIVESDSINPLDKVNVYNGGGVGVGDFNGDGLQDLFFTGNLVSNRLYLNKGGFKFDDITTEAGVYNKERWSRGVAVVDINNDGRPDIYVCNTLYNDSLKLKNFLYINQGNDKNGIPKFKDEAKAYGLEGNTMATMASFFDYDNDGDLDMYLTVNDATVSYNPNVFGATSNSIGKKSITGKLYRNNWDSVLHHPVFEDVSKQAGVNLSGFGHAATTVDINGDGWKDIYVSDDFISNNLLYINNHDGTFTDRTKEYFKHTSLNSMGQDIIDINNDGLPDVIELDMDPPDNFRKKMMLGANSYQNFQSLLRFGYEPQYVRNTLQLNQGPRLGQQGRIGSPVFSEIGFLSGIAQTDWSWTPLVTDFDNDGFRDIVVTNGFRKDLSDQDFMAYRQNAYAITAKAAVIKQIPEVKIDNYAFKNSGKLSFEDVSKSWGITVPTFSNGAVYVDLDNDGAMDIVINNINDEASVYRNTSRDNPKELANRHFIQIGFKGAAQNRSGLGASAAIFYNHGRQQVYENDPYRGYLSTLSTGAFFGLGNVSFLDSVLITWPDGKKQKLTNVKADQHLIVDIKNASTGNIRSKPEIDFAAYFKEITDSLGIHFAQKKIDFIDFNIQKLLPHKLSEYNPALAVGDIDGNGLDDIIIGGDNFYPSQVFLQLTNGRFRQRDLLKTNNPYDKHNDAGLLLFDADGDHHLDLYAVSGGYEAAPNTAPYQDRFYINDGKGNFSLVADALPRNYTSKLCVKASDFDKDGKPDLFVSGRVDPWHYPKPVSSIILKNKSTLGHPKFVDVTTTVAPMLKNIGLVCDALFTDYNNDGWPDLIIAGEWMPITFLKNQKGKFINETKNSGVADQTGWWNAIVGGDFRHTGRIDYIIGNTGKNTLFQASAQYPVYITAGDFTKNRTYDAIPSLFLTDQNGKKQEFPAYGRDDVFKEVISLRPKFTTYKAFAVATMDDILPSDMRKNALRLQVNQLKSCFLRNDGNGKFKLIPLPAEAQFSAINGMETGDFDGDGNLDAVMNGNDFGTDVAIGRYDALNGLMLKGDGKGGFKPQSILQSGIYISGDGKALVKLRSAKGKVLLAASQHLDSLKVFEQKSSPKNIAINNNDAYAIYTYKNGRHQKQEFYYGSSFLSQSARFISLDKNIVSITVFDDQNQKRVLK